MLCALIHVAGHICNRTRVLPSLRRIIHNTYIQALVLSHHGPDVVTRESSSKVCIRILIGSTSHRTRGFCRYGGPCCSHTRTWSLLTVCISVGHSCNCTSVLLSLRGCQPLSLWDILELAPTPAVVMAGYSLLSMGGILRGALDRRGYEIDSDPWTRR